VNARRRTDQGPQPETWQVLRTVLIVVRNLTSLDRLMDYIPLFAGDGRIGVVFTVDRGSNFSADIEEHLKRLGVTLVRWEKAIEQTYDLIIAAHANKHICRLHGPILLVSHGVGYNRRVVENTGDPTAAVGTSDNELTADGIPYPKIIGVSHPDQIDQIKRSCPQAADRARLIGDPTFDRMRASMVRRREYRRALGIGTAQKLVVVTSTWGGRSLMGAHKDFVHRLVAQLPMDEFRVALVLHPNIWVTHTDFKIKQEFRDAMDGGLLLIPPDNGWRAALIAADLILGDHGSVTFYGFALQAPTAQVADGLEELTPDSALAMFCHAAVVFNKWHGVREQLAALVRDHDPLYTERIATQAIDAQSDSHQIIYEMIYEELRLTPPAAKPRMVSIPAPTPIVGDIRTSFTTSATVDVDMRHIVLTRLPGTLADRHSWLDDLEDSFRVVDQQEVDSASRESADVFTDFESRTDAEAKTWIVDIARQYVGAKVIATMTGTACLTWVRNHQGCENLFIRSTAERGTVDVAVASTAIYAWVTELQSFSSDPLEVTVTVGAMSSVYSFSVVS
jgi:hypothetical protein